MPADAAVSLKQNPADAQQRRDLLSVVRRQSLAIMCGDELLTRRALT